MPRRSAARAKCGSSARTAKYRYCRSSSGRWGRSLARVASLFKCPHVARSRDHFCRARDASTYESDVTRPWRRALPDRQETRHPLIRGSRTEMQHKQGIQSACREQLEFWEQFRKNSVFRFPTAYATADVAADIRSIRRTNVESHTPPWTTRGSAPQRTRTYCISTRLLGRGSTCVAIRAITATGCVAVAVRRNVSQRGGGGDSRHSLTRGSTRGRSHQSG